MIKIINVEFDDFKRLMLMVDKSFDSNSHLLGECDDYIIDDERQTIFCHSGNDGENELIVWNVENDELICWRNILINCINEKFITNENDIVIAQMVIMNINNFMGVK